MYSDLKVAENAAKKTSSLAVLYTCLHTALRLTHPTMPFLTEELWHRLPGAVTLTAPTTDRKACGSIAVAAYPKPVPQHTHTHTHARAHTGLTACARVRRLSTPRGRAQRPSMR